MLVFYNGTPGLFAQAGFLLLPDGAATMAMLNPFEGLFVGPPLRRLLLFSAHTFPSSL